MEVRVLDDVLERLRAALERDDLSGAASIIEALRPADQAEVFAELEGSEQIALLPEIAPEDSADILEEMEEAEAAEIALEIPTDALIRIVEEMEADEVADLLGDIEPEQAEALLDGIEDPEEIRPLLLHPDDSAGGLMTSEFLALRARMSAADALAAIRAWEPDAETAYYLFVVDRHKHLVGVINLRQLVVADPKAPLNAIMDPEVIAVPAGTDQEECARLMQRYDLLALPVVDRDNVLLGVITIDDVVDVLEDEATEDIQRLGASQPLERAYLETDVFTLTKKRIGWLLLLFVTGSLTSSVMDLFEPQLQAVVELSFFIPLLIGTGGNAGSQATSTIIRALAVGDVGMRDAFRAFWHEVRVGLILGLAMGAIGFGRLMLMGDIGPELSLTVSLAIFTVVVWANGMGALLPVIAVRLGVDPTVVSGPAMSTLVDATGLFIYFTIAILIMHI